MILEQAVVVVTGARNTGKTILASTYLPPAQVGRVFYHDAERSANRVVQNLRQQNLSFGYYGDLQARFSDLPSDDDLLRRISHGNIPWIDKREQSALRGYYDHILEDLDTNLTSGQYTVYIHDTLEKFEAGMQAYVEDNIKKFGFISTAKARQHGRIWSQAIYPLYEQIAAAIFARGVQTIILCSHLRTPWEGNRPVPGKVEPSGKPLLQKLASLMVWLVSDSRNPDGAPAGLVLKERLGELTVVDGKWRPRRMLPARIPHCTWEDIDRYLEHGCDLSNPAEGETLSQFEKDMISEMLTDKQVELMIALEKTERDEPDTAPSRGFALDDKYVTMARELGVTVDNRDEIAAQMIATFIPPLQANGTAQRTVEEAIKEVLGG